MGFLRAEIHPDGSSGFLSRGRMEIPRAESEFASGESTGGHEHCNHGGRPQIPVWRKKTRVRRGQRQGFGPISLVGTSKIGGCFQSGGTVDGFHYEQLWLTSHCLVGIYVGESKIIPVFLRPVVQSGRISQPQSPQPQTQPKPQQSHLWPKQLGSPGSSR